MPATDSTKNEKIKFDLKAYELYLKSKDPVDAAYSLRDTAEGNMFIKIDTALKQMIEVVSILNKSHTKIKFATYWALSDIYSTKSDYKTGLIYLFKALNTLKPEDEKKRMQAYELMGYYYGQLHNLENALKYDKMVLEYFVKTNNPIKYYLCFIYTSDLIKTNQSKASLTFLTDFFKKNSADKLIRSTWIAASFGSVYNSLQQFDKAEKYFLAMML